MLVSRPQPRSWRGTVDQLRLVAMLLTRLSVAATVLTMYVAIDIERHSLHRSIAHHHLPNSWMRTAKTCVVQKSWDVRQRWRVGVRRAKIVVVAAAVHRFGVNVVEAICIVERI